MKTNAWLTASIAVSVAAQLAVVYVPALNRVLDAEPLDPVQLAVVAVASTAVFVAVELEKAVRRRRNAARYDVVAGARSGSG
jgi:Ca2+-transporting ATPase